MGLALTAFTKEIYTELYLPNINDSDYRIALNKNDYKLRSSVSLLLDIVGGKWKIHKTKDYAIICNSRSVDFVELSVGVTFSISTRNGEIIPIVVTETENGITATYRIDLSKVSSLSIGSSVENDIVYAESKLVSRQHAVISKSGDFLEVKDVSKNGTFYNSRRIKGKVVLKFGESVNIFGLKLIYLDRILAVTATDGELKLKNKNILVSDHEDVIKQAPNSHIENKEFYNRSPRILGELFNGVIEIEEPPRLQSTESRSLFMTIGPAFTMVLPMLMSFLFMMIVSRQTGSQVSPFMFIGVITAFSSALIGILWGTINYKKANQKARQEDEERFQAYSDYLREISESIKEKYEHNLECLCERYPSSVECSKYNMNNSMLWNRNISHEDYMCHRIGTGSVPFQAEIRIPKKRFSIATDSLAEKPSLIREKYEYLFNAPVCIDLKKNCLIGVVGGEEKKGAIELVKNLMVQIAANNCYTDVKICCVLDNESSFGKTLSFAKWLPHIWSEDKKERYFAVDKSEASDVFYELTKVFRQRGEAAETAYGKKTVPKPHYVLIVENPAFLEGELIAKYIFENKDEYGLTTILLAESYETLPNSCGCIVYNSQQAKGVYTPETMANLGNDIQFDTLETKQAEIFARSLSGIQVNEIETGGEITNSLSFLQMYHVSTVEQLNALDRWKKNRTYTNMRALIGQKAGGADCYLDIHEKYHGPHGLVAGTTGSGKSETLQTYILSLAVNFSPDDIAFFIIDFKGGGMANLFSNLPHLSGQISNLSGNQVHRAMVSIKSENMRRQRIFNEHGVNNINNYTRLVKNNEASTPVPHLFIIIDEFAELKREQPDFMRELISVAQVGRSLGVHLILATQKPSGTVDDNIRSNSKFKLCLRVQDRQDSIDMIQKADAAYLTQAGRCYLQVGNDEIFELFQSGWSGAVYDEEMMSIKSNMARLITNTGKTALVGNRTQLKKREKTKVGWIVNMVRCIDKAVESVDAGEDEIAALSPQDKLVDAVFDEFSAAGIAYVDTSSNRARSVSLIKLSRSYLDPDIYLRCKGIFDSATRYNIRLPEKKDKTQLDAVVEYLGKIAAEGGYAKSNQLWLPVLPEKLYLSSLISENEEKSDKWNLDVTIGLCDDPTNQAQFPCSLSFSENGHLAVFGGVTSGKSTFIQTVSWALINKYSPRELNIYAIDFSNHMLQPFQASPSFGEVMYETDLDLISKFFFMLRSFLAERKNNIRGGSFAQYAKTNPGEYPAILVIIDNYASFKEKTENAYENTILEISRDGVGFGILLMISAGGIGINDFPAKILDNFKNVVALDMGEKMKFADVLKVHHLDVLPEEDVKGRGLTVVGGSPLEFQTALAFEAEDDYSRARKIEKFCVEQAENYNGRVARNVPKIPEKPTWTEFAKNPEFEQLVEEKSRLPFAYNMENASVQSFDLSESYCLIVGGASRTGRTNALKILMASAHAKGADICLVDKEDGALEAFSKNYCNTYVKDAKALYGYLSALLPEFKKRNGIKREMISAGADDGEIYQRMSEMKQMFIFVADIQSFLKYVYTVNMDIGGMSGFVENILEKGSLHNIYFIVDVSADQVASAMGKRAFSLIASYKKGIYLGGNLSSQRILDFSTVPFSLQGKSMRAGTGFATPGYSESKAPQIIIPLAKGLK